MLLCIKQVHIQRTRFLGVKQIGPFISVLNKPISPSLKEKVTWDGSHFSFSYRSADAFKSISSQGYQKPTNTCENSGKLEKLWSLLEMSLGILWTYLFPIFTAALFLCSVIYRQGHLPPCSSHKQRGGILVTAVSLRRHLPIFSQCHCHNMGTWPYKSTDVTSKPPPICNHYYHTFCKRLALFILIERTCL